MKYFVYLLRCRDSSLYCGITNSVERRLLEHNTDDKLASKYTRARRPVVLIYSEEFADRSDASKREAQIKKMTKEQKEKLINANTLVN